MLRSVAARTRTRSLLDRMRAATRYDAKILWKYEPKQDPNVILVM